MVFFSSLHCDAPDLRWVEDDGDLHPIFRVTDDFYSSDFTSHNKDNHATIHLTKDCEVVNIHHITMCHTTIHHITIHLMEGGEVVTIHNITTYHITIYHIKVGNQGWWRREVMTKGDDEGWWLFYALVESLVADRSVMAAWMLHGLWFGEEAGARNRVFFRVIKVVSAVDARYLVCAAGSAALVSSSNRFSLGVLQRVVAHVCVLLCACCIRGCRSQCNDCVKVACCRGCARNIIVFCSWTL